MIDVKLLSGALGAEISGIDISKKLTNTETQLLQENFLKFKVLLNVYAQALVIQFIIVFKKFTSPTTYI